MADARCIICRLEASLDQCGDGLVRMTCPRCGSYAVSRGDAAIIEERIKVEDRPLVSEWVYEKNRLNGVDQPPTIELSSISVIKSRIYDTNDQVNKKITEARFFLKRMAKEERKCKEHIRYDFYLSAFLSATRSIDYRLRHEHRSSYPSWRKKWDAGLSPEDRRLIKFMVDDRNIEVHQSGSGRGVTQTLVLLPVGHAIRLDGTKFTYKGPPGSAPQPVPKRGYTFAIDGANRAATETCAAYLTLLQRMVSKFRADNP